MTDIAWEGGAGREGRLGDMEGGGEEDMEGGGEEDMEMFTLPFLYTLVMFRTLVGFVRCTPCSEYSLSYESSCEA